MIRRLACTSAFLAAIASPAVAQVHPDHTGMPPHDHSMHTAMDSATHAVVHALIMGSWAGTITTPHGSSDATMSIAQDSLHQVRLTFTSDQHALAGTATDFALRGDTLQWTQELAGTPCKATIVVSAAVKPGDLDAFKGSVTCTEGNMTFALKKQTK